MSQEILLDVYLQLAISLLKTNGLSCQARIEASYVLSIQSNENICRQCPVGCTIGDSCDDRKGKATSFLDRVPAGQLLEHLV